MLLKTLRFLMGTGGNVGYEGRCWGKQKVMEGSSMAKSYNFEATHGSTDKVALSKNGE